MIMHVDFPVEPFNTLVRNGTVGAKIQQALEDIKPEVVFFSEQDGHRGGVLIVDVPDPSKIPVLCEPLFLAFNAKVKLRVAMTPDDLAKSGLDTIGKRYSQ